MNILIQQQKNGVHVDQTLKKKDLGLPVSLVYACVFHFQYIVIVFLIDSKQNRFKHNELNEIKSVH